MKRRTIMSSLLAAALFAALFAAGCGGGDEGSGSPNSPGSLTIDFATYNPLSLIIKEKGWLEAERPGSQVRWIQSAGSNKANENLRAGAIDVGSTAGSAALLARANGSPIQTIGIFSQPEWAAIVVRHDSPVTDLKQLAGKRVAVTKGTDPYFFLLQALEAAGLAPDDVTVENLQHADGRVALENGSVDAWSGLDPLMAASEAQAGSRLIYRNIAYNTYGFLNATERFLSRDPKGAQLVVDTYERARRWAQDNAEETAQILARVAGIDLAVAKATLSRTALGVDPVPGAAQRSVLSKVGPILVASGDVPAQRDIDRALDSLFRPNFAEAAPEAGRAAGR